MKAKIEQLNVYKISINGKSFDQFKKVGTWEGMTSFHCSMGTIIIDIAGKGVFDDIFAEIFGTTLDVSELTVVKMSMDLIEFFNITDDDKK